MYHPPREGVFTTLLKDKTFLLEEVCVLDGRLVCEPPLRPLNHSCGGERAFSDWADWEKSFNWERQLNVSLLLCCYLCIQSSMQKTWRLFPQPYFSSSASVWADMSPPCSAAGNGRCFCRANVFILRLHFFKHRIVVSEKPVKLV